MDSVAILFKAYVNRTIQVYEEKGMTDDQVRDRPMLNVIHKQLDRYSTAVLFVSTHQRAVLNSNFQFITASFIARVIVQLKVSVQLLHW